MWFCQGGWFGRRSEQRVADCILNDPDRYGYDDINEYLRTYGYHFTTWGIQDYGRENYPFCEHETCRPIYTGCERTEHGLVFNYAGEKSADEYGKKQDNFTRKT